MKSWLMGLMGGLLLGSLAAADAPQDRATEQLRSALLASLPHAQPAICQISYPHPKQWAHIETLLKEPGVTGACDLPASKSLLGSTVVQYHVYAGGKLRQRIPLSVRIEASVPVLALTRDLPRGSVLSAGDVQQRWESVARVPYQSCRSVAAVAGKQARVRLTQGSLLQPWMLGEPTLVFRNDPVSILCQGPLFLLKVAGTALQDGGRNEHIRVRNSSSQKILLAEVLDQHRVRVTAEAQ